MREKLYSEDSLIPISALQHILFCERRAALVHIERVWTENVFTAEGRNMHQKSDDPCTENRGMVRIVRGLIIHSQRLGLIGKMDVVEFEKVESGGITLLGVEGFWQPRPIEYKRGLLREEEGYEIQLCAQALCLEEMLKVEISTGDIYYGKSRRRLKIEFDQKLRRDTEAATKHLHDLIDKGVTPKAHYGNKCERCSLMGICLPRITEGKKAVDQYLSQALTNRDRV